jgi:hypothetical protein
MKQLVADYCPPVKTQFYIYDPIDPEQTTIAQIYQIKYGLSSGWKLSVFSDGRVTTHNTKEDAFKEAQKVLVATITVASN